ncbi:hypothetical protein [uncultured Arthrobacter sp.]|uniref:hypothetical protein n=1 Tax=uncultured Arthrobacter sp. TaxID=114050 RepID=UPI002623D479|nr:hypothetical protein [uncultured Arthrobacter sp.]
MTGTIRTRSLALPRAVFILAGLTAVIIGVLGMHVWMGGHGPTAAHGVHTVTAPAAPVHHSMAPTAGPIADAETKPHLAALSGTTDTSEMGQGCAESCGDHDAALGLCVLAFIVVTILAFLLPAGRLVPGTAVLRGPPWIRLRPLTIPAPSLIRLCISRT